MRYSFCVHRWRFSPAMLAERRQEQNKNKGVLIPLSLSIWPCPFQIAAFVHHILLVILKALFYKHWLDFFLILLFMTLVFLMWFPRVDAVPLCKGSLRWYTPSPLSCVFCPCWMWFEHKIPMQPIWSFQPPFPFTVSFAQLVLMISKSCLSV